MKGPIIVAVLILGLTGTLGNSCKERLPDTVDIAICDRIYKAVHALHDAVKDVDGQVRSTVVGFLEESREIVKADTKYVIEMLPTVLKSQAAHAKRNVEDIPSQLQTLATTEAKTLTSSVKVANQEIQDAILKTFTSFHDANDKIAQTARDIMGKIFVKRDTEELKSMVYELSRRNIDEKMMAVLAELDKTLKESMQKPIQTAMDTFTKMLDLISPSLRKAIVDRVNIDFDQAKADVMKLTLHASAQLVEYYDDKAKEPINAAVLEVDQLVSELYKADATALAELKTIIEDEAMMVYDAVQETRADSDQDVINSVLETAKTFSDDYTAILNILNQKY